MVVVRLSLYSPQSLWLHSDYPYTHHSLHGGPQYIPLHITVSLVVHRLSLYRSQSLWWYSDYLYTHTVSLWWYSEYPYTHHSLPSGTQTIPILITVSLVLLRLSLCSPEPPWWYSDYPYIHQSPWWYADYPYTRHSLPGGTHSVPTHITVSLVVLIVSLYSSQSPWWNSGYSAFACSGSCPVPGHVILTCKLHISGKI